jgi:hypothetical protein
MTHNTAIDAVSAASREKDKRIAELEKELAERGEDTERLDWVEAQGRKTGFLWIARHSLLERGYRVHQIRPRWGAGEPTARAAIDSARAAEEQTKCSR